MNCATTLAAAEQALLSELSPAGRIPVPIVPRVLATRESGATGPHLRGAALPSRPSWIASARC